MKSLVLGGNGFIGAHLVDSLLEEGWLVKIYDRSPNRFRATPGGAEYVEGELGNHGLIRAAVEGIERTWDWIRTLDEGSVEEARRV